MYRVFILMLDLVSLLIFIFDLAKLSFDFGTFNCYQSFEENQFALE